MLSRTVAVFGYGLNRKGFDEHSLDALARQACGVAGLKPEALLSKLFPDGVSNIVLADKAHFVMHTWPDTDFVELSFSSLNGADIDRAARFASNYFGFDASVGIKVMLNDFQMKDEKFFTGTMPKGENVDKLAPTAVQCLAETSSPLSEQSIGRLNRASIDASNADLHGWTLKTFGNTVVSAGLLAESHNIVKQFGNNVDISVSTCKARMDTRAALDRYLRELAPRRVTAVEIKHELYTQAVTTNFIETAKAIV
jgi:S-adenosylmethionine/arginine decarboxylase-like enzyme